MWMFFAALAFAGSTSELTVRVVDEVAAVIESGVVIHAEERHRVHVETGEATLVVVRKQALELEVAAPGYVSQTVELRPRKRRETRVVVLSPLSMCCEEPAGPPVLFERDAAE